MVVDSHFHLVPHVLPVDVVLSEMDKNGIDKVALIGDLCSHINEPNELLLQLCRFLLKHNASRFIVKRLATQFTKDGNISLPSSGVVTIYENPDNKPVFDTVAQYPERFMGWAFVNPSGMNDPITEFEKWVDKPGFIGVKTHPFWHRYNPSLLLPLAEKLAGKGIPLLMHLGFDQIDAVLNMVNTLPDLKIQLAHAAFPGYSDTWKRIKNHKSICIDFAATHYVDEKTMIDVVNYLGVERCFLGTDGPFGSRDTNDAFDFGHIKSRIETHFPDTGIQRRLSGENFLEFISR